MRANFYPKVSPDRAYITAGQDDETGKWKPAMMILGIDNEWAMPPIKNVPFFETKELALDAMASHFPDIPVWKGDDIYTYPHYPFTPMQEKIGLEAQAKREAKAARRAKRAELTSSLPARGVKTQ